MMMEFEDILFHAKHGCQESMNKIVEIYSPMLIRYSMINGYFDEDLYQELLVEVLKCIHYFKVHE